MSVYVVLVFHQYHLQNEHYIKYNYFISKLGIKLYLPRVYAINTLNAPKAKTHLGIGGYCDLSSLDAYK